MGLTAPVGRAGGPLRDGPLGRSDTGSGGIPIWGLNARLAVPYRAERLLGEASERALRQPGDRLALVLHLSRLKPPAPRSYHIRIARVLMQDSAARFDGQVFQMRNQDLVLLCNRNGDTASSQSRLLSADSAVSRRSGQDDLAATPGSLPSLLGKLFSADADPAKLTSLWQLDRDAAALRSYLAERANGPTPVELSEEQDKAVLSVAALQGILNTAPLRDLLVQQTGMSLDRNRSKSLAERLSPAFQDFELSLAALNLGPLVASATADPFLCRHLASGLDERVLALVSEDLASDGRLTRAFVKARLPLHLSLGLETILSPGFARLLQLSASAGVRIGASISLMQACADLDLMDQARRVLMLTGAELILTQVDPLVLEMVRPAKLAPDLVKIMWSPILIRSPSGTHERTPADSRLYGLDVAKIVLQHVDSHEALAWGKARGISLFQGAFLDHVQAATRMAQCHSASGCTIRQCGMRASSANILGRAGCRNHALLDTGLQAGEELASLCP